MNSYPEPQDVREDLGDKTLHAIVTAVDGAREDLREFREIKPGWFVDFSQRLVANFIHDRIWAHMKFATLDNPDVTMIDAEPVREVRHGSKYRLRIKRHSHAAAIETFPTKAALNFWCATPALPGLEQWSLAIGYIWDGELGEIKQPVISFRDSKNKPRWMVELDTGQAAAGGELVFTPIDPVMPAIDFDLFDGMSGQAEPDAL
ncbi:hypothetical protein ACFVH4_09665 [Nocardia ignorata]|uniref:hypothetical protein n=1 Tax=Nocardia ignorata TaxID=145285 RepID=UPI0036273748